MVGGCFSCMLSMVVQRLVFGCFEQGVRFMNPPLFGIVFCCQRGASNGQPNVVFVRLVSCVCVLGAP